MTDPTALPRPPPSKRSAENDGGEALQKQRIADERIGRAGLRADEDAGHAIEDSAENEGAEPCPLDRDADRVRGLGVASDREHRGAELRPPHKQPDDESAEDHDARRRAARPEWQRP